MGKRQSKQKGKGRKSRRHERRRVAVATSTTAAGVPWRNIWIVGGVIAVLVIVAALVFVNSPRSSEEPMYLGIQSGFTEEGFPYLGSLEADVVLTEFTDYYCSHCRNYHLESAGGILEDYVATGQVRYVLHHYSNGSAQSLQATDAAMCAADQGLYFQFQHTFFQDAATTREEFIALGRDLGLDEDAFLACWDAGRHRNTLMEHIRTARALGISSTPSFMINDKLVLGNRPDVIRQTIEDELVANR